MLMCTIHLTAFLFAKTLSMAYCKGKLQCYSSKASLFFRYSEFCHKKGTTNLFICNTLVARTYPCITTFKMYIFFKILLFTYYNVLFLLL